MADPAEQGALDQPRVDDALVFEDNLFTPSIAEAGVGDPKKSFIPSAAGSIAISSAASKETKEETRGDAFEPSGVEFF